MGILCATVKEATNAQKDSAGRNPDDLNPTTASTSDALALRLCTTSDLPGDWDGLFFGGGMLAFALYEV